MIKSVFLFLIATIIGIGGIISYVTIATAEKNQQYETPIVTSTKAGTTPEPTTKNIFSLDNPPSESLQGMISTMSGTLQWQSRTATQPAELKNPVQIEQGELLQTGDTGTATVLFANCCSMLLSPDTSINFVQTLPANVVLEQTSGTAEYFVTNSIPVAVRSLDLLININSGDVLFSVSKTRPFITVTVKKGTMEASFNDLNYNSTVIPVMAGQTFYFNDVTRDESIE